jgi:DhnA family fructose-bisphosphate aldolase class Ia
MSSGMVTGRNMWQQKRNKYITKSQACRSVFSDSTATGRNVWQWKGVKRGVQQNPVMASNSL